jgi:hypothetical protein
MDLMKKYQPGAEGFDATKVNDCFPQRFCARSLTG